MFYGIFIKSCAYSNFLVKQSKIAEQRGNHRIAVFIHCLFCYTLKVNGDHSGQSKQLTFQPVAHTKLSYGFGRAWVTWTTMMKNLWYFSSLKSLGHHPLALYSMKRLLHEDSSKYVLFYSTEEIKSSGFRMTWKWIHNYRNVIFRWTVPLSGQAHLMFLLLMAFHWQRAGGLVIITADRTSQTVVRASRAEHFPAKMFSERELLRS